jgi:2-polyprenyl-3-methyl-5-hydroxy-6-metoxy-1,4-benzoquinol methylase
MSELDRHAAAYDEQFVLDNRLMLDWYPRRVAALADGDSLLELGLGHGWVSERFRKRFGRYLVVEGSPEMIQRFRSRFDSSGMEIVQGYFEDFTPAGRFHHVNMGFVLEHVEDPGLLLRRYRDFLEPGGSVFVAVPNAEALHRRLGHLAGLLPSLTQLSQADLDFGHRRYFTLATLRELVEASGYQVLRAEGILLKPITTSQIQQLDLSEAILGAMLEVGRDYPELCNGILLQACPR